MKYFPVIVMMSALIFLIADTKDAYARVCIDLNTFTQAASVLNKKKQPAENPGRITQRLPVGRSEPYRPRYLGDGMYLPEEVQESNLQSAYNDSRTNMDRRYREPSPMPSRTPKKATSTQKRPSASKSSSSGTVLQSPWNVLVSKAKSGACSGICF